MTSGSVIMLSKRYPTLLSHVIELLFLSSACPNVCGVVGPTWPWVTSGIPLDSSANFIPYSMIPCISFCTLGMTTAKKALRTSVDVESDVLYQILLGVNVHDPSAGTTPI